MLLALVSQAFVPDVRAQTPSDQQISLVLTLLPKDARAGATVLVPTDTGYAVHREGRNAFVCETDRPGDDRFSIACYHESLRRVRALEQRLAAEGFSGPEFGERLCAKVGELGLSIPHGALELTASATATSGVLPDSVVVHHLLYFPNATEASIGVRDEDVPPGGPWLHKAGTCQAHVMWHDTRYLKRDLPIER